MLNWKHLIMSLAVLASMSSTAFAANDADERFRVKYGRSIHNEQPKPTAVSTCAKSCCNHCC